MAARSPQRKALCAGLASIMICPPPALAGGTDLPMGGQVSAGAAAIDSSGGQMLINQSSARAVIDWTSFDIGQQSGVTFHMPGTSAAVLNRVTGATPSTIAGSLTANGQVFLVNPNGIAITSSGTVRVGGGFTASTLGLGNDDFLEGRLTFSGNSPASITNAGRIEAGEGGFAALIAQGSIDNRGLISVPAGRVALGTGSAITLDPTGTGFMQILAPAQGEGSGTIRSSGRIVAEGGSVEIKAASAAKAVRDIVNVSGEVSVASARKQGGAIILESGASGLRLSGKLNASSREAKGGSVAVGGKRIALEAAQIDVKGTSGGMISVGGGRQGAPIPGVTTAAAVSIDAPSIIDASALTEGGGDVIIWSQEDTRFLGNILATGAKGDGGAAEVSSLGAYVFAGGVNLLSAESRAGELLLDPYDVVISAGADANQTGFTATGSGATINATSLQTALGTASVTVLTGSSGSEAGNITLDAPLTWSANTTLTLDAAGGIILNQGLTASGTGSGITLTAAGTGGVSGAGSIASDGTLTFNVNSAAASGVFAGLLSGTGQVIKGGSGSLTLAGANSYTGATSINTGTVRAGSSSALGNTSGLTLAGTFDMAGNQADIASLGGSGTITNSGSAATLTLGRSNVSRAFSGTIDEGTAPISLVKAGNGSVTFDGLLRYTGSTTINGGLLQVRGGSLNNGSYSGSITINANSTLRWSSGVSHLLSGAITGTGTLQKDSSTSVLTLSNASGFTGTINVNAGWLRAGSANGFGMAALSINAGTTLDLAGFSSSVGSLAGAGTVTNTGAAAVLTTGSNNASTTFSGVLQNGTGALGLTKTGTGTLTLSGTNTYTGATTINAGGMLQLGDGGTTGSVAGTIANSGTLVFNRSDSFTYASSLNGAVTKLGSGTLTYTGTSGSATITISQGAFQFGDGGSICCITPTFVNNASLIFNHSVLYGYNGTISGTGSVTKLGTGTLDFTGANSYTGSTTISAGTLRIRSAASATGLGASSGITVNGTLDLTGFSTSIASLAGTGTITNNGAAATLTAGSNNSSTTFSGTIQNGTGVLSLTKVGTGVLTLTNNNSYTGQTAISTGTLTLTGNGTLVSDIAVASGATLSFSRTPFTYAGVISGTGSLNFSGGMTFTGNNTFTGTGAVCTGCTITVGTGGTSGTLGGTLHFYAGTSLVFNRSDTSTFAGSITGNAHIIKDGAGTLIVTGSFNTGTATINAGTLQIGAGGTAGAISNSMTNNSALVFNRSDALTYAGAISGTGTLTQAGSGTLTLTGNNTYTGVTTIAAGTLQLGNGGTTGMVAGDVANSGLLTFNRSDALTYGNIVSGTGGLTQMGSGTLILTGNNTYTGVTTINATRSLQIGNGGMTGSIAGNITNNGALVFNRSTALTYGGVISGTGTLTQSGTGTLTLSMPNTATGVTTVASGSTLQFGIGGFSGSVGGSIVNNGLVILNHSIDYIYGTPISGSGSLTKIGPNNLTFGDLAYTGVTTISAGTLQLGNGGTTGSVAGNIVNNSALVFNRSNALTYGGVISGTGTLTQAGSGTLTLSGANSYTGATSVTAGTLKAGSAGALGSNSALTVAAGAVFDIAGNSNSVGSLSGAGTVTNSGSAATLTSGGDNTSTTFSGVMQNGTGTLALVKAGTGTFTVTGANTYTGGSTISGGTMQIGDGGTTGDIGGAIVNNGQLIIYRSNRWTQGGSISGPGSVLVRPGGAILSRDNSYTGLTTVESGATVNLGWGGATGTLAGPLLNNGYIIVWRNPLTLDSTISGNGSFEIRAFLTLTANSSFSGTTQIVSGSVTIGNGGTSGSWGGTVNGSLGVNRADLSTFNGSLTGSLILNGTGTVVLTGSAAGATINAGTLQIGDGGTTGSVSGSITNTGALVYNRSNALTQSGIVSGSGSLTQAGAGTLTLSAANTYSGATNVTSGTLKAGSATALGSNSAITVSAGASLDLGGFTASFGSLAGAGTVTNSGSAATLTAGGNNASTTFSGVMQNGAGTLALVKAGTGTFTVTGANTYTGGTTVNAGGTLQMGDGGTTGTINGSIVNTGSVILNTSTNGWFNGFTLSGTGSFTKAGTGTVLMSTNHTYTGGTTVTNGALWYGAVPQGSLTVNSPGQFYFNNGGSYTYSGVMSGSGLFLKYGAGTLTLTGDSPATSSFLIVSGSLQIGNGGTSGNLGATLTNNTASSVVINRSDDFTYAGILNGSINKAGAGKMILARSGSNFSMTVSQGTLQIGDGASVSGISGSIVNNAAVVFDHSNAFSYASSITGTGSLTKSGSGTLTLSGSNSYSGETLVSAGALKAGSTTALSANSALTLSSATTLDLAGFSSSLGSLAGAGTVTNTGAAATLTTGGNNASTTFAGVLQNGTGTLALNKTGTGKLTLTSVNTLTGGTTIAAGGALQLGTGTTGAIYGNILNNGTLIRNSAGSWSPGSITGTGDFQLLAGQTVFDRDQAYTGLTTIASGATLNVGIGGTAGNLAGNIANDGSLVFNRSNLTTYSGALSGTGSISKAGAGTLILSGANAYTGATALMGGTLKAGSATAFGNNSAVTLSSGTSLDLGGVSTSIGSLSGNGTVTNAGSSATLTTGGANTSTTFSGVIQNGAAPVTLVKAGTGTFTLSGVNAYTGSTTVASGSLKAGSVAALGSTSALVVSTGATLDLGGYSTSIGSLAGDGTVTNSGAAATLTAGGSNASTSFSGTLRNGAGALSLIKLGTGTLTLAGDNSHTGPMTVNAGSVELSGSWSAGSTGVLEVANGATISGGGTLTAGLLTLGGEGTVALTGANMIGTLASSGPVGSLLLNNAQSLTLASMQARGALRVMVSGPSSDLTIAAGAIVRSDAAGNAVSLSSGGRFTNASGAGAVSTPNGRWLIYLPSPSGSSFSGLDSGNTALWNTSAGESVTQPGSRYVFAVRPTLTVSSNNLAKTYGQDVTAQLPESYTIAGFDPGVMGAYLGDSFETALSGAPIVTSAGASANGPAGTYQVDVAQGSLTSLTGYDVALSSSGLLTVDRAGLTVRARDVVKTYDGLAFGGGNGVTYEGFVNGEAEDVLSGSLTYGGAAQGAVNAGRYGLSVSGLSSGNYDISYLDGVLVIQPAALPEAPPPAGPIRIVKTDPGWMGLLSQNTCCLALPRIRYAQEWLPDTDIIAPWLIEPIEEIAERY